jgi:hypothetical protein
LIAKSGISTLLKSEQRLKFSSPTVGHVENHGFHDHLKQQGEEGPDSERQQQVLRVYFGGIYENIRQLLSTQVKKLSYRYGKIKDVAVKRELDRLKSKMEQLPERWDFRPR